MKYIIILIYSRSARHIHRSMPFCLPFFKGKAMMLNCSCGELNGGQNDKSGSFINAENYVIFG